MVPKLVVSSCSACMQLSAYRNLFLLAYAWYSLIEMCVQDNLVDEVADLNTVPNEKQELDITAGISNSFGFGGHNSVVAFAPFKQ